MSPTPEHGIERRALAPELESEDIPIDTPLVLCKTVRPLDEDEDGGQISSKRRRLEDGTAQIIRHKQERNKILKRHGASYRLNRHGSGVFTLNKQIRKNSGKSSEADNLSLKIQINCPSEMRQEHERRIHGGEEKAPAEEFAQNTQLPMADEQIEIQRDVDMRMVSEPATSEDILGQGTLPGGEEIEIEVDMEMSLASSEETPGQNALALEPQVRPQDIECDQDEELQVAILLEGGEAKSATGEQNRKALESVEDLLTELEPEYDSEGKDPHETSSWDTPGYAHQDPNDHISEVDAPVVACQVTMEHHELGCAPLGGDGGVPDEENPPMMGEALVTPLAEHNDAGTQSLRREGVAERPCSLEDQDKKESKVHSAHSEEPRDQWQNDAVPTSQAARRCSGQVESRVEPPSTGSSTTRAPKLNSKLEEWVNSKVNEAREKAREKDEEEYRQVEAVARKGMEEEMRQRGQDKFNEYYPRYLVTWTGTPESLKDEVWKSINSKLEASYRDWDNKSMLQAQQRERKYQEDEDCVAKEAEEAAHSQINQGKSNMTRSSSSFIEALQLSNNQADEAWLEREISSSALKQAEKAMSQQLRRRQTLQAKEGGMPSARAKAKGKAREKPLSFSISEPSTTWAPSTQHTAAMLEEVGATSSAGPSQSSAVFDPISQPSSFSASDIPTMQAPSTQNMAAILEEANTSSAGPSQGSAVFNPILQPLPFSASEIPTIPAPSTQHMPTILEEVNASLSMGLSPCSAIFKPILQPSSFGTGELPTIRAPSTQHMAAILEEADASSSMVPSPCSTISKPILQPSSFGASELLTTQAPSTQHMTAILEEVNASSSMGPSQGSAIQETTPLKMLVHRQALHGYSGDQQMQSEQEVAERRHRRKARALKEPVEAYECEEERRRMKEVRDALLLAQRAIPVEPGSGAVPQPLEPMPVQAGSPQQISGSSKTPSHNAVSPCNSDATRERSGDVDMDVDSYRDAHYQHISAATRQLPGQDSAPDPQSMGDNTLLNQLIERYRDSESTLAEMAHQISELRRAVVSMAKSGTNQGLTPPTIVVDQAANPSNLGPPPTQVPEPSSLCAKRIGPPGTFRNSVPPPVHRDKATNQFHHDFREVIKELLQLGDKNYWPTPPTEDELNQYETSRRPADGPTQDNFRLDFTTRQLHKSVWNQRAADIFVETYVLSDCHKFENRSKLKQEFLKRLKRIHEQYRKQESGDAGKSYRSSSATKRQRRRRRVGTLYESRETALQSHMTMQRFIPALKSLSRGGMSEDESDHASENESNQAQEKDGDDHIPQSGPKRRRYKVLKMQWRSVEVTTWLRTMDLVYVGTKFYEDNTAVPGNQFRLRYPSDVTQIGRPITGLPRNFYNPAWLNTLTPEQLAVLDTQPEININFTVDERKYAARYISLKGKGQKGRVSSYAEANPSEVSQWVLTGAGFWEATHGTGGVGVGNGGTSS